MQPPTPAPASAPAPGCWLCAAPLPPAGVERCPGCGLHQARELPGSARWRLVAGLLAIYAVSAVLLVLTT